MGSNSHLVFLSKNLELLGSKTAFLVPLNMSHVHKRTIFENDLRYIKKAAEVPFKALFYHL